MTVATGSSSATVATRPRGRHDLVRAAVAERQRALQQRRGAASRACPARPSGARARPAPPASARTPAPPAARCRSGAGSVGGAVEQPRRSRPAARVKPRRKPWTARAVASGCAIARFFGTSSPKTIVTPVARTSAIASATPGTAPSGTPTDSSGPSTSSAIDGSAMKPISRLVTVMPTCATESCVDRVRSALWTPRAPRSPPSAARSTERAVDGDERELGRDERPAGHDQRERDQDQEDFDHRASLRRAAARRAWDYSWGRRSSATAKSSIAAQHKCRCLRVAGSCPSELRGCRELTDLGGQIIRRFAAQRVISLRLESCSLRRMLETWVSIVLTDRCSRAASSL